MQCQVVQKLLIRAGGGPWPLWSPPRSLLFELHNGIGDSLTWNRFTVSCLSACITHPKCKGLKTRNQERQTCELMVEKFDDPLPDSDLWVRRKYKSLVKVWIKVTFLNFKNLALMTVTFNFKSSTECTKLYKIQFYLVLVLVNKNLRASCNIVTYDVEISVLVYYFCSSGCPDNYSSGVYKLQCYSL